MVWWHCRDRGRSFPPHPAGKPPESPGVPEDCRGSSHSGPKAAVTIPAANSFGMRPSPHPAQHRLDNRRVEVVAIIAEDGGGFMKLTNQGLLRQIGVNENGEAVFKLTELGHDYL